MTQEFREDLGDSSITCLQYFGSPFHVNSAFYPFIRQLEWAAGVVRTVLRMPRTGKRAKAAPKYQSKKDKKVKWSGRGMLPIWMREEMKGTKLTKDDFLIK